MHLFSGVRTILQQSDGVPGRSMDATTMLVAGSSMGYVYGGKT